MAQGRENDASVQNVRHWLALKLVPRLSTPKKIALVEKYSLSGLLTSAHNRDVLGLSEKQYHSLLTPDERKISKIISQVQEAGAHIICFDDPLYPQLLKQIYDPPLVLFVRGDCRVLSRHQIAIVGSRNVTAYGIETTKSFSKALTQHGLVVTSGLALGVDAYAHRMATNEACATIAVTATGIDIDYPSRNKALAREIVEQGGAIVTEFLPGTLPKPGHFPRRNRIISGLAHAVLVIEAAVKSGSLITAKSALEQNREVFALPGSIYNTQSAGCHWLIKQGAKLVENVADIIDELGEIVKTELNLNKNNNKELTNKKSYSKSLFNDPLLASVGHEITPVDKVVSRSKLPTDVVLTRLTMLELRGLVTAVPGGYLKIK
ncbi:DNA-processing protein DprA [Thalassotalea marina]|uniref:DNA processing protein DprA n=1 Tax=Thalassotalea marina TaxID=1673741 RepID=A0A919BI26_9GAMM|nr:DNA-processing protein DprA [Thalassotalea marina]GHF90308.1 DNA processing protein DprA [Thalassotalea marina]